MNSRKRLFHPLRTPSTQNSAAAWDELRQSAEGKLTLSFFCESMYARVAAGRAELKSEVSARKRSRSADGEGQLQLLSSRLRPLLFESSTFIARIFACTALTPRPRSHLKLSSLP